MQSINRPSACVSIKADVAVKGKLLFQAQNILISLSKCMTHFSHLKSMQRKKKTAKLQEVSTSRSSSYMEIPGDCCFFTINLANADFSVQCCIRTRLLKHYPSAR